MRPALAGAAHSGEEKPNATERREFGEAEEAAFDYLVRPRLNQETPGHKPNNKVRQHVPAEQGPSKRLAFESHSEGAPAGDD